MRDEQGRIRWRIFDALPQVTEVRERNGVGGGSGNFMIMCSRGARPQPKELGDVWARNKADAVQAARDKWPTVNINQFYAMEA